jgi:hypothetical protein
MYGFVLAYICIGIIFSAMLTPTVTYSNRFLYCACNDIKEAQLNAYATWAIGWPIIITGHAMYVTVYEIGSAAESVRRIMKQSTPEP